jgi:hypothetical protein
MMDTAFRFRQAEAYPHCGHEREGLHQRLHLLHTCAVHAVGRLAHPSLEDRPLHVPTPTVRSRARTDQQRADIRAAVRKVLLRSMGQAGGCGAS